ncbi:MAG: phage tail sheath subtilisin-like domain-containing protein [Solirubrobacterales bacterium]|jgi:hypothetical protein
MPVFFNGRLLITPAVASVVDDSAMFNRNPSTGNILAIIGQSAGGQPATALRFGSAQEARNVLIDGEALKAIEKAFDPSAQVNGPSEVVFVRVNPATQAALAIKDGSAATVINLLSTGYGRIFNQVKVKIETGTNKGKKVTSQFGNGVYSQDDVYRDALSITYTGANATATAAVSQTQLTLTDAAATVIELSDFPTVANLVERINSVPGYAAAVIDGNGEKPTLNALDTLAATSVKNLTVTVTGVLQAIIDYLNSANEGLLTATRQAGAGTVPANIAFTYLAGATDGNVTNTEWQAAFDALQSVDVQWVVPLSSSSSIHAMADTHVAYMSNVARMERRAFVGGASGTTDVAAIAAAKAINSDRTAYVHLGFYDYDANGALTLYPPYIAAAMVAGAFAGINPGTAMTNKTLKVRGLERNLRNPTDTDQLVKGGVLTFENTPQGYKVVKSISTFITNGNYNRVEISTGVAVDYVARTVRDALADLRGAKGSPTVLSEAVSRADSALRELARPEPIGVGIIVGDKTNPAYRNITATLEGDVVRVEFECSPVIPVNFILIAIHARPWSGSVSV